MSVSILGIGYIYWFSFFPINSLYPALMLFMEPYIRLGSFEPHLVWIHIRVGSARTSPSMTVIFLTFWQIYRKVVIWWQLFRLFSIWRMIFFNKASPKWGTVFLLMLQQGWCCVVICFLLGILQVSIGVFRYGVGAYDGV